MSGRPAVTVRVPATTANLGPGFDAYGLALAAVRPTDGELALLVRGQLREGGGDGPRVTTDGEGAGEVPTGDDNLIWRGVVSFCEHHDVEVPDATLTVHNHLPLERGLGSSSAAIVAGLLLGRALTGTVVGDKDLVQLATDIEGHPDNVAPALLGGLVACTVDDGGRLVLRRRNPPAHLRPFALVPPVRQLTTAARAVLPEHLPRADVVEQASRAGHVLGGLAGLWPVDAGAAGDRLHEPPRFAAMPSSGALVDALRAAGIHAWLSGAGPTVIAVPGTHDPAVVREAAATHGFVVHELVADLSGGLVCPDGGCAISGVGGCVRCPRAQVASAAVG